MDEQTRFASLWAKESDTTRKVLERIPEGSEYRPDPKSRPAQEIAWQIVMEEAMIIDGLESGTMTYTPQEMPSSMTEIARTYADQSARIRERWNALPRERWEGDIGFFGSQRSAAEMAWSFLLDIVHHRGQITTYLRAMGSTVPQIYGPSADEP